MKIIGIDPGTRYIGVSVLEGSFNSVKLLYSSLVKVSQKLSHPEKLHFIYFELRKLIQNYQAQYAAVEDIFIQKNIRGALKIGQARGVILLTFQLENLMIAEFSPREVKQSITGNGNASKQQVAFMVRQFFPEIPANAKDDITDAVAVAFCYYNRLKKEDI